MEDTGAIYHDFRGRDEVVFLRRFGVWSLQWNAVLRAWFLNYRYTFATIVLQLYLIDGKAITCIGVGRICESSTCSEITFRML